MCMAHSANLLNGSSVYGSIQRASSKLISRGDNHAGSIRKDSATLVFL